MLSTIFTFVKALLATTLTNETLLVALKTGVSKVAFGLLEALGKRFFPKVPDENSAAAGAVLLDNEVTEWLQKGLNLAFDQTVSYVRLVVDGDYGPKTREAVLLFQAAYNAVADKYNLPKLKEDEWAGEETKAVLNMVVQGFIKL